MTRTRLTVVAALIAPLALAASGCGKSNDGSKSPGSGSTTTEKHATTTTEKHTTTTTKG